MYDPVIVDCFLKHQLEMYSEPVADTPEEAEAFLEDTFAAVASDESELMEYLEEVGVDTEGMSLNEILDMPEVMRSDDGRFLILEV
ncbi:MAG: glyoxalase [Lachnospiraceae bacterium]|nr:glyoxalase [Lachnospiraceae bacterium]